MKLVSQYNILILFNIDDIDTLSKAIVFMSCVRNVLNEQISHFIKLKEHIEQNNYLATVDDEDDYIQKLDKNKAFKKKIDKIYAIDKWQNHPGTIMFDDEDSLIE